MPESQLERRFEEYAEGNLRDKLGTDATYYFRDKTHASYDTTKDIRVIFNEYLEFIDDIQRALITFSAAAVPGIADPRRGDKIVLTGETLSWHIVDLRKDRVGTWEATCKASQAKV